MAVSISDAHLRIYFFTGAGTFSLRFPPFVWFMTGRLPFA
jgi:hypothetical protein